MSNGRVEGKVAFITGAGRGQGRSHAVRLAEEGADIIGVDICKDIDSVPYPLSTLDDLAETARLVEAAGRKMVTAEADVRDVDALRAAVADGVSALGRLDIVVANAGIWSSASASAMAPNMWQDMIDVNLTGVWNTCQATVPVLVEAGVGGSIVLISSVAGLRPSPNLGHYAAAKHGVVGIMRSLANEVGSENIRVNAIHPTAVGTAMIFNEPLYKRFRPDLEAPGLDDVEPLFRALNKLPVSWVEPIDISHAVVFLASDESRYITSVSLPVDAGSTQR